MSKKLTTEEWIAKARKIHGDRYGYEKTIYVSGHAKVLIICRVHGEFWQDPYSHLKGINCNTCAQAERLEKIRLAAEREFLTKATELYSGFYNYSQGVYVSAVVPMKIICPKHGEFWQTPYNHSVGHKCRKCSSEEVSERFTSTTAAFIEKATAKHGQRYGYQLVNYKAAAEKVEIVCKEHGSFFQTPNAHLRGAGCPECSKGSTVWTKEAFVEKAVRVHGRYDYSKFEYTNTVDKSTIICPEHGEFLQSPNKHLMGRGCPACADISRLITKSSDKETFIERALEVHGPDLHDYDEVVYVNSFVKVKIGCKKHGTFFQTPAHHLGGNGCPECGKFKNREKPALVRKKFLKKADELFSGKFTYNVESYRAMKHSMEMTCPDHGVFLMTPKAHLLSEAGCPRCEIPEGYKRCTKCKKIKKLNRFHMNKAVKMGYSSSCKKCVQEFNEGLADYSHYGKQLTPCDKPTNVDGKLFVACKKCRKMFQPTRRACSTRVDKINKTEGESNFYCSDDCKNSCSLFNFHPSFSVWSDSPRKCDKLIKQALVANQCDEAGEIYCEICGDTYEVDFHHVLTVKEHGNKATHPAASMLLCPGCHTKLHAQCK